MISKYTQSADYDKILETSRKKPVFLFKYSSACSVSRYAWEVFTQFSEIHQDAEYWQVYVIEDRPLSLEIQDKTGVRHESPQVILFRDGKAVWNDSHFAIHNDSLTGALTNIIQ